MNPTLTQEIQQLAEHRAGRCRVLGNSRRVLILWLLAEQKKTVSEIALAISASQVSVNRHLSVLKFYKLVEARQESDGIYYQIVENELARNCLVLLNKPDKSMKQVNPN